MNSISTAAPGRVASRFTVIAGLAPLLLSLAVSNAYAAPTVIRGAGGAGGADGTATAPNGVAGSDGQTVIFTLAPAGVASNVLTVVGGNGGTGGAGWEGVYDDVNGEFKGGGNGGSGGNGGQATGAVRTVSGAAPAFASSTVFGGSGNDAGAVSNYLYSYPSGPGLGQGGNGGAASSSASAIASGAADAVATAVAHGGHAGYNNDGWASLSGVGVGGGASASAFGQSDSGNVTVGADAIGGHGGAGFGATNVGGAGVELNNAVSGATSGRLSLSQSATGGNGGNSGNSGYQPADLATGGNARSTLTLADNRASALHATVAATGGTGSDGWPSGDGGAAHAGLTLSSTRSGAAVTGNVSASGGAAGADAGFRTEGGKGGAASATASLTGRAAVTGRATAIGGSPPGMNLAGGNAAATLSVTAGGLASGSAAAYGGIASSDSYGEDRNGTATSVLTLAGAGASGTSLAQGASADATVRATTTGAQAVNVGATATGMTYGYGRAIRALTEVTTAAGGGRAEVVANASAFGADSGSMATSTVNVVSHGNITGSSQATGGYVQDTFYRSNGGAVSTISGETSGASAVTLKALARGDVADSPVLPAEFGKASANAYGRSGSGVVNVTAEARGGSLVGASSLNAATAQATALTTERGGVSTARALVSAGNIDVRSSAQAIDSRGNAVGFAAGAGGEYATSGTSLSSSRYEASAFTLAPLTAGTYVASNASAAPDSAASLALGPNLSGMANLVGVGSQTLANGIAPADIFLESNVIKQTGFGQFQFTSAASEHLLIGFVSSTFLGAGFDALDLLISNNGVQLFAQSFTSLAAANLFFNDHLLDLGAFGGGTQNLSISSTVSYSQPSAYAFNYVLGLGYGGKPIPDVSAVPEPSAWLMMVMGMGGVMLVARRRRARQG